MSIVELERMPEFEILNSLVTQQDISCANAVQRIVEITLSFTGNNSFRGGGHLYDTACCTLELAQRTETREGRSKLVDFELELQKQDILNPASGMRMDNDGDLIWQDLPTFGYTFVDELGSFSPTDSDHTPEENHRFENLTSFVALLTASSTDIYTDFCSWALTAFSYAFESNPHEHPETPNEPAVRCACLWFVYASDKLWQRVGEREWVDFRFTSWKKWKTCLTEWRDEFEEDGTRMLIGEALKEIERVEDVD